MSNQFEIRKAILGDESSIAKVHIRSWQEAYRGLLPQNYLDNLCAKLNERTQMWINAIKNPQRWTWVATIDNEIVGFIIFGPPRDQNRDGFIELGAIYLLEEYKNKKIGISLLMTGFNYFKSQGYDKCYCWVLKGNPTINFYEKTGALFSGQSKFDEIGGEKFQELAYDWSSMSKLNGSK